MEVSTHPKVTWKAEHIYVWAKKNIYDNGKFPKGEFPIGSWTDEPDKVQWTDKKTGLACVIKRGPMGVWCGYVGVGPANPYYKRDYMESGDAVGVDAELCINVHGGLTFAGECSEGDPEHAICHIPVQGATDHVWWFGFDCGHGFDFMPWTALHFPDSITCSTKYSIYRDIKYVKKETTKLAKQLALFAKVNVE